MTKIENPTDMSVTRALRQHGVPKPASTAEAIKALYLLHASGSVCVHGVRVSWTDLNGGGPTVVVDRA